jgi:hypothetical protein
MRLVRQFIAWFLPHQRLTATSYLPYGNPNHSKVSVFAYQCQRGKDVKRRACDNSAKF